MVKIFPLLEGDLQEEEGQEGQEPANHLPYLIKSGKGLMRRNVKGS